jgi:hypothetical protein
MRAGSKADDSWDKIIDAFLASNDKEMVVDCKNPQLMGYRLNKSIIEKKLERILEVRVESDSYILKRSSSEL